MMNLFRRTGILGRYVFVSRSPNLEKEIQKPGIPNSSLIRLGHMEGKTPRIELYRDIDDALSAGYLGQNLEGAELYVYQARAINSRNLYTPEISEVPYSLVIKEIWSLAPIMVRMVCKIKVGRKKEVLYYFHGPRSTKEPLYRWSWKETKDDDMLKIVRKQFSDTKDEDEKKDKKRKRKKKVAAGLGVAGGVSLLATDKDKLVGRVVRYHNTENKNVDSILKDGIKTKFSEDPNNLTNTVLTDIPMDKKSGLIYTSKSKSGSNSCGAQRSYLNGDLLGRKPRFTDNFSGEVQSKILKEKTKPKHSKTLKLIFDYDKDIKGSKKIENPEIGGMTLGEYTKKVGKKGVNSIDARLLYRTLGKKTHVFDHDISPEHIKESEHFKKRTFDDFTRYVKNNPKRFGKEAAKIGLGVGLLAGAGVTYHKNRKKKSDKKEKE